jgi:hypothetical protein
MGAVTSNYLRLDLSTRHIRTILSLQNCDLDRNALSSMLIGVDTIVVLVWPSMNDRGYR